MAKRGCKRCSTLCPNVSTVEIQQFLRSRLLRQDTGDATQHKIGIVTDPGKAELGQFLPKLFELVQEVKVIAPRPRGEKLQRVEGNAEVINSLENNGDNRSILGG